MHIDACISFVDPDAEVLKPNAKLLEAIEELTWVAEHDFDGGGREAEVSVNKVRKWIKDWLDKPMNLILKIRGGGEEEEEDLEEKTIQDEILRNYIEVLAYLIFYYLNMLNFLSSLLIKLILLRFI
ncbi:MAG TPA: hypothetical protein VKA95_16640 [Nitrososphaeraceae archaeon]|nr:hypothetical protein [Nitrososphaeraceae archaeon]